MLALVLCGTSRVNMQFPADLNPFLHGRHFHTDAKWFAISDNVGHLFAYSLNGSPQHKHRFGAEERFPSEGGTLNKKTLQCAVVEIELTNPTHICGPDCPCWTVPQENRPQDSDGQRQNLIVMPRLGTIA